MSVYNFAIKEQKEKENLLASLYNIILSELHRIESKEFDYEAIREKRKDVANIKTMLDQTRALIESLSKVALKAA